MTDVRNAEYETGAIATLTSLVVEGALADDIPIARLRACHELISSWAPRIAAILQAIDENELIEARARVAEIEQRLGVQPNPIRPPSKPSPPPMTDFDQTDAGQGIGGGREAPQSAQELRDELAELREHTAEKRRKRGIA